MTTSTTFDDLTGLLRQAVAQATSQSPAADVRGQALARIARRLADQSPARSRRPLFRNLWLVAPLAAVLAFAISLAVWQSRNDRPLAAGPVPLKSAPSTHPTAPPFGGQPAPSLRGAAGANASRRLALADNVTVLVSTGNGDDPIALGDAKQYDTTQHTLHVWDWSKGKDSRPLKISYAGAMAVSPNGEKIVTADARLIDVATGAVAALDNFEGTVHALTFSPDGKTLLLQLGTIKSATARLLEMPSARKICEIPQFWGYTFAVAFTPDGRQLIAMGADRFVRRFDAQTGKELAKYEPAHSNSIRAIVVSDDGKLLASCASSAGEVRVWDLASAKLLREYDLKIKNQTYPNTPQTLAFSHDGKLLANGGQSRLVLWSTATGTIAHVYPTASGGAIDVRFSADDSTITTITDFTGLDRNGLSLLAYPNVQQYAVQGVP